MHYFPSPEAAVPLITEMLRQQDFANLASYYDLSGSDIPRERLDSGAFFLREDPPEAAHPGGFWRYEHPFAPGFEYRGMRASEKPNVFVIEVEISIEQGAGAPDQVGRSVFAMIQSAQGWQILPDRVDEMVEPDVPRMADDE